MIFWQVLVTWLIVAVSGLAVWQVLINARGLAGSRALPALVVVTAAVGSLWVVWS